MKNQSLFECPRAMYVLIIALGSCASKSDQAVGNKTQVAKPLEKHFMEIPFAHTDDDANITGTVDTKAEYPGGEAAFNQYINAYVQFHGARQGRTFAEFVIEKDGSLSDIKIIKSVGKDIDDQVIPALKACKKWKPASFNGRPVRTRYVMPVSGTFMG